MDKFSLYDLLGLLLPGSALVWCINLLNEFYTFLPFALIPADWDTEIWILLCLSLIAGAVLYASGFWLVQKNTWYPRLTGIYKPVSTLYLEMPALHSLMNATLNGKAQKWYGQDLFFNQTEYARLTPEEQAQAAKMQDEYYDRMYYELEYHGKIEQAKTFQSFYFFFRQLLLACLVILKLTIVLQVLCLLVPSCLTQPDEQFLLSLLAGLLFAIVLSILLARWYRKRMVCKIYWAYFTHLNQTIKS